MHSSVTCNSPVRRLASAVVAVALVLGGFVAGALPASADPEPSVTSTTVTSVPANATTPLTGVTLDGFDPVDMVSVTVSTDVGTLAMTANLGNLVLEYGNSWSGTPSISFWTLPRDANLALASLSVTTGAEAGPAHVAITALPRAGDQVYSPTNGHFYSYVADSSVTWEQARVAARSLTFRGQSGYLATMDSAALNDLVSNRIAGAANVFFGGMSTSGPPPHARTWAWVDGPLAAQPFTYCSNSAHHCDHVDDADLYSSWAGDEPNNFAVWDNGTGEWVGLTNVNGSHGLWNDIPATMAGFSGYLVEFGDQPIGSSGFDGLHTDSSTVQISHVAAAPTEVTAVRGNQTATVSFVPGNANGAEVTGYRVTASPGGATEDCPGSPCSVTGLTNGQPYTFSVVTLAGEDSSASSADSAAVTPATTPDPPTGVTVTAGQGSATVRFTAPAHDGGSGVTGYTVTATPGGATATCQGSPCRVTGLTDGTLYRLTVHATNDVGDSPETAPSPQVTPSTGPGAPTHLTLTPGDRTLTLAFQPPASDGGSRITRYQWSDDKGRSWTSTGLRLPLHAVDAGVLNGARYTVLVRAVNANGHGPTVTATVGVPAWFADPVSRGDRQDEIAVPKHPKTYSGPRAHTRAEARSHAGKVAVPVDTLRGRQLQRGQAVGVGSKAVFRFDSAKVSTAGRARIKAMAKSLRYVHAVSCEGYADYGGTKARENKLGRQRSHAVCALIHRYAKQVTSRTTVSFGPKRPVVVGGTAADRAENRRVVVVIR